MSISFTLEKLSQWQQTAFCSALLERMLPNYQMFAESVEFGDVSILRNQLDLVWQWLDKNNRCKINYQAQLLKLEPQIPDPEEFDTFGVFPALDACMAVMSLLQGMQDTESEGLSNVGRLSENSVSYYVELILAQEIDEGDIDQAEISEEDLQQHPLMQWEHATQNELYDFLVSAPENKQTCLKIKAMVLEEGLSNLGIEI